VRTGTVVLALAALAAGCGSSGSHGAPAAGTLDALRHRPGEDVAIVSGTSDYAPGQLRVSFLVVTHGGRPIDRPRAEIWIARALRAKPFERTAATLETVAVRGAGGTAGADDVTHLYVAHVHIAQPGTFWLLAQPVGGKPIQAIGTLVVKPRSDSPAIGSHAYPSRTPTLGSAPLAKLTTAAPPDRALLRYSIADSLRAHAPFVVTFATPRYCESRTCGPVVNVVDRVRREFAGRGIRFIHVEIYRDNDPTKGENEWVRQWHLPTEPWTFVVRPDGRIASKFEGALSVSELAAAVRSDLLRGK
jgi:hypothetical protein